MGIKDLLKFTKPCMDSIHVNKYAGKRVGIDAYSWLHKGAYSCSMEICLDSDSDKKSRYLDYCMHRIDLLRHYKIVPVVVFDGGNLPCKALTEQERHRRRKANRDLAMEKLKEENVSAATELFQRAVSITPSMAHKLIQLLREQNIEFVVAPYEADAQLAYLSNLEVEKGGIVAVITEDSDLIAYGCKAVVFKMDRHGNGEELLLDKVFYSPTCTPSFRNFDMELFTGMCVLAGCDFLPSVPGIGIAKAYALVSKYRNLDRVLSILKLEKRNKMSEVYARSFKEAMAVFRHAQIYDINTKKLRHMTPVAQCLDDFLNGELHFLGPEIPASIACSIAEGRLDPITMEPFNPSPSPGCYSKNSKSKSMVRFRRSKASAMPEQDSCFTVVPAPKVVKTQRKRKPTLEVKYLNESPALDKLIVPTEIDCTTRNGKVVEILSLQIPDNNPFKRKTGNEIVVDCMESVSEEISVANEVEYMDVPFSRKRKCEKVNSDETESGVTQAGDGTRLESQESLNSDMGKISCGRKREKKKQKPKTSNCKDLESKRCTIFNFFSRV